MTKARVLTLGGERIERPVNRVVVETLEELLRRAKDGEINGLAVAYDHGPGGGVTTWIDTNGNRMAFGQALSALWFRYQTEMMEDSE